MGGLTEDTFFDIYEPIKNPFENNGWDGTVFETFGEQLDMVSKVCGENPKRIWTLVDDDKGNLHILAGMRLVNRFGYFITKKDWATGEEHIVIEME